MLLVAAFLPLVLAPGPAVQLNGPAPIASETVSALSNSRSFGYMLRPFADQTGSRIPAASIPLAIRARSDSAFDRFLPPGLRPPRSPRAYVGFRKPPDFEQEFMCLAWTASQRRFWWSDLDPQAYLLIDLLPGELQASSDDQFKSDLLGWVQANLKVLGTANPLAAHILLRAALPSGHALRVCTVTSASLEQLWPHEPEEAQWATGFTCWIDGRMICMKFNFPTLRQPEAPSPDGRRVNPYTRSRFDPPGFP